MSAINRNFPGLEAALVGMKAGEARDVVVSAEEGFGEYDDELVLQVDRAEFPDPAKVEIGDEFVAEAPDGEEIPMRVIEIEDDGVVIDANHPLAGVTLHYSVKVREVRAASTDEIEKAATEFEEAEDHAHGPGCNHDHGHEHGAAGDQLVTLGTKKSVLN